MIPKTIHFLGTAGGLAELPLAGGRAHHPLSAKGFPLVLLEVLSMGTPVVASACDGILDVVRDGENGLLVKLRRHAKPRRDWRPLRWRTCTAD